MGDKKKPPALLISHLTYILIKCTIRTTGGKFPRSRMVLFYLCVGEMFCKDTKKIR
nr:MAG TPA: hypothetical protein [Caudoviricetes sp.]